MLLKAPVLALPLVGSLPDHPPDALQLVAFAEDQLSVAEEPLVTFEELADSVTVGLGVTGADTVMLKGERELELMPSLTLRTMLE